MLLENKSLADFDSYRTELKSGVAPNLGTAVDADARRALHLHALLAERKRRSTEAAVLNDLARCLSTLRDPDTVLTEVALQTRHLLGVDVSYLMLRDDHDQLHIEVTDGSVGNSLHGVEVPADVGIGGRVLRTGNPFWCVDYLSDTTFTHLPDVDAAAVGERLSAVLGVPLRTGGDTIGVLFAADRSPRRFSDHDVDLLSALAAHSAVAIRNANLIDQLQRAVRQLKLANDAIIRSSQLWTRLTDIALGGASLDRLVGALGAALDAEVEVLGPDNTSIAAVEPFFASSDIPSFIIPSKLLTGSAPGRISSGRSAGRNWLVAPVVIAGEYCGCVVARMRSPVDAVITHSLETGVAVIGLVLSAERAAVDAVRRSQEEAVWDLLTETVDKHVSHRRAVAAGVDVGHVRSLVVIDSRTGDVDAATGDAATRLAETCGGWSVVHCGRTVLLLFELDLTSVRRGVQTLLTDETTAVVASTQGSVAGVRQAYRQARNGATLLWALGKQGCCTISTKLALYESLFIEAGQDELSDYITTMIGPLLDHDVEHHSDLVQTLEAYLTNARRHAATARKLHIHANTLYQRLTKINEVLGTKWHDPDNTMGMQFALRLNRLMHALGNPAES